jgi:hypothetical protein
LVIKNNKVELRNTKIQPKLEPGQTLFSTQPGSKIGIPLVLLMVDVAGWFFQQVFNKISGSFHDRMMYAKLKAGGRLEF